ncbi:hypothetical protein [Leifsonia xyli]|nr:hypothetical protein [Leifsonia xyli]
MRDTKTVVDSRTRPVPRVAEEGPLEDDGGFSFTVPGEQTNEVVDAGGVSRRLFHGTGDALGSTKVGGTVLSVFPTENALQVLMRVPSPGAVKEYRFPLEMMKGLRPVVRRDGSVAVVSDGQNDPVGGFAVPWAVDAHGEKVGASFRLEGGDLIETINVRRATAFPVTASLEQVMPEGE